MKRFVVIALALILFWPLSLFAAGTASIGTPQKITVLGQTQRILIPITFTADGSAAEATATLNPATYGITGWYLYKVETDPGATGPTNGAWDLDITDARGYLISRNLVDDRSSTATQEVIFTSGYPMIEGSWSITIGDNAVNNAVAVAYLTFTSN